MLSRDEAEAQTQITHQPWLAENADVLGFGEDTAQRLMRVATKYRVNAVFDEADAVEISRDAFIRLPTCSARVAG